jgi:hypothetical protein
MTNTRIVLMIAVLCGLPAVSQAQPVDVGVTIGAGTTNALGSDFGSSFGTRGLVTGAHVTLPINERFAIQPLVTYGRSTERFHTARPTLQAFMTYGLAAGWERDEVAPMTYFNGRTNQTIPGYTSHDFAEIPISLFGGGVRQAVGRHLAIRAEAQVSGFFIIPIGIRGSIGLAVALGK